MSLTIYIEENKLIIIKGINNNVEAIHNALKALDLTCVLYIVYDSNLTKTFVEQQVNRAIARFNLKYNVDIIYSKKD